MRLFLRFETSFSRRRTIGKLIRVLTLELEELKQTLEKIALYRDIDAADGVTLDLIGKNLKQPRAHLGDGAYRTLLKTKIKRNTSRGDINTIIEVFAAVMDIPHEKVYVREVFPAGLYIRVPLTPLQDALFDSATIIGEFVQGTLAGGVGLEVPFEGTFEFASALTPEMDDQKGFSDLEQEIGVILVASINRITGMARIGYRATRTEKKEGWLVTEKPADWFNWLFHGIYRTFVRYEEKFKEIYEKFTNHLGKGGSTHPNATQTISGFLSGPDKKKLDEQVVLNTGGTFTGDVKIDAGLTVRLKVKKRGKDSNGKFTTVEWRRKKDNTLFMRSVLSSPDINGNYQTDTWYIYNAAGTAVIETVTWPLTNDADGDFVESS